MSDRIYYKTIKNAFLICGLKVRSVAIRVAYLTTTAEL